jgi:hypothetical protein
MNDARVTLTTDQVERLVDLVNEYRDAVASGEISGYGQSQTDELVDVDTLRDVLKEAR